MTENLNLAVAFSAGVLSFFSPCIIAVLPIYLASLAGVNLNLDKVNEINQKKRIVWATWLFALGFSVAFSLAGALSVLAAGLFLEFNRFFSIFGGVLLMLFGLMALEWIKIPSINIKPKWSNLERFQLTRPLLAGLTVAFAWSACIGPILGAILLLASQSPTVLRGVFYLFVYSLGLILPIILIGYFIKSSQKFIYWISPKLFVIKYLTAFILIAGGFLILTGNFSQFVGNLIKLMVE